MPRAHRKSLNRFRASGYGVWRVFIGLIGLFRVYRISGIYRVCIGFMWVRRVGLPTQLDQQFAGLGIGSLVQRLRGSGLRGLQGLFRGSRFLVSSLGFFGVEGLGLFWAGLFAQVVGVSGSSKRSLP